MFSQKQNKKTVLKLGYMKKNLPLHDAVYNFVFRYFPSALQAAFALHNKR